MEVAIPIVGLGAMYLISNQNKEDERDGFIGMQNTSRRLPNTRTPPGNYPVENKNAQKNNILSYSGANPDSDLKPYNPSGNIKTEISQKNFTSLTGNNMNPNELKHNNIPIFARNFNPPDDVNLATGEFTILDNFFNANERLIYEPGSSIAGVGISSLVL